MAIEIKQKIVGYTVLAQGEQPPKVLEQAPAIAVEQMHERIEREELLHGSTYKIKTPQSEHALYITINDIVLNGGTEHEERRPYEIFINSKNMENFQWVLALTRLISAIFRKGGDVSFLVEELGAVFDPRGGYFKRGGVFMPSLVAEIGEVLNKHLKRIGMIKGETLTDHTQAILAEKRAQFEAKHGTESGENGYPKSATLCNKCNTVAVIIMDGCGVCLCCSDSKCG